jgi:DNA-binding transcriptional LysR family regulator
MNFRTLDLNLLRVFDTVMVERNVTRAAARLAMTQPAVSNALRRLREATDEELFVAGPTGVKPTAHAEALWPAVRSALEALREVFDPPAFDPARDAHAFTLAMTDSTAVLLMPRLVPLLDAPRVDLRVLPLASRDPRAQLEHGQLDAAVGFFPDVEAALAAEADTALCRLQPLYECDYMVAMRPDHPLAAQPALSLDDFCAAQHLRVSFHGRVHGFVDEALARLERTRRVVLTVNQFSTGAAVVAQSDLIAVLPLEFITASGLPLVVRPAPIELPRIRVGLLWHRRHDHDAAQSWLRERVARAAESVPAARRAAG